MRAAVSMRLDPVAAPVPLGVLELPLAAGRPAVLSAWISPPAEGGVRLATPLQGLDADGAVIRHDMAVDRLVGIVASTPPGVLTPEGLPALMATCGFEAVREPGWHDRLFLTASLVVCAYEDASVSLREAGHGDGAMIDSSSREGRRLASAILRLRPDGALPDTVAVVRDLSRISAAISAGTSGYVPALTI